MVVNNQDTFKTAYTISIDATSCSTGISSYDRSTTIKLLASPSSTAASFNRPGHVFPLRAVEGGVLKRVGHTEASVDLCGLTGKYPVAAISEIVIDEGGMMRREELRVWSRKCGLKMISIEGLVKYRLQNPHLLSDGWSI